jgi:hypothetical protein
VRTTILTGKTFRVGYLCIKQHMGLGSSFILCYLAVCDSHISCAQPVKLPLHVAVGSGEPASVA